MTAQELQTLIDRGAAQPGIHEVQEMMRLTLALEQQARDLASIYTAELTTVSSGSGVGMPSLASYPLPPGSRAIGCAGEGR